MRHSIYLIHLLFISLCVQAQTSEPLLERRVSVVVNNQATEFVLTSISKQAGLVFSYSPSAINVHNPVSINMVEKPVKMVLSALFHDEVNYKAKGNYIILRKNTTRNRDTRKIEGYVYDKKSGQKLTEASVYDKKLMLAAVTDKYGYFSLKVPSDKTLDDLRVSKNGYIDTLLLADTDKAKNIIEIDLQSADSLRVKSKQNTRWSRVVPSWLIPKQLKIHSRNLTDSVFRRIQFSFLPQVSTNSLLSGNTENDVAINLTVGYAYSVRTATVAGLLNIIRTNASVCQLAGIGNLTGGKSVGMQGAGIINYSDSVEGAQCAGVVNIAAKGVGVQGAGIANITRNAEAQLSGVVNLASGQAKIFQASGILNAATQSPLQLAGICNVARAKSNIQLSGIANKVDTATIQATGIANAAASTAKVQVAGIINTASRVDVQVSGLINKASKVKTLQLGLVNVSDTCQGIPVGLFSYCKTGYHKLEMSYDEMMFARLSFRTGVKHFHTMFSAGMATAKRNEGIYTYGIGLGTSFGNVEKWLIDVELSSYQFFTSGNFDNNIQQSRLYVGIDRKVFKKMSVAVGLSYNALLTDTQDAHYQDYQNLAPYAQATHSYANGRVLQSWLGATLALRFF